MKSFKQKILMEQTAGYNLQPLLDKLFETYTTIQHHHWNIEGPNFGEYHTFFGDLYEFAYENLDKTAEQMRALGWKVKLNQLVANINPNMNSREMMMDCVNLMNDIRMSATKALSSADSGLSNYLEGLIDETSKKIWMAESYLK